MDRVDGRLIVSASDLVGHLACEHLTALGLQAAGGSVARPTREDPEAELLQRRGLDHEAAYLARARTAGRSVVEIDEPDHGDRLVSLRAREAETRAAMVMGADVVFQGTFLDERDTVAWRGHADFLTRVDRSSGLGDHAYEPEDTKLARHVKPSAVLQLCHYAEQVERLQGVAPERIHVVLGGQERVSIRLVEVAAYYRAARARFLEALDPARATYPTPVGHCGLCAWHEACTARWEADDHLSRVAGLGRDQVRKLARVGISTLAGLAASEPDLVVTGMGAHTLARLQRQARLQHARPADGLPPVEPILPVEAGRGLAALPAPDPGDLFYDIEGDPFVGDHGIEYLHGLGWVDDGAFTFRALWAHDAPAERRAFEALIDLIVERRRRHPNLHVYHYAPYETSALGKLMGRYGTREQELDDLLRADVFVDLYRVVRQGVAIGSPSYSLKKLEPLYMPPRTAEITDAGSSIVEYERWLQTGEPQILHDIEAYNRDDVESTWRLRDWLEARRAEVESGDGPVARPGRAPAAAPADDEDTTEDDETQALIDELLAGIDVDGPGPGAPEVARVRWLVAHLLRWHQREDKPEWWQFFRRVHDLDLHDLHLDTEAVAGLEVDGDPEPDKRSFIWTYRFDPDQEHKLKAGAGVVDPATERLKQLDLGSAPGPGTLVALDATAGTLQLRRGQTSTAPHPAALIPAGPIATDAQRGSLRRLARALLDAGIDGDGPFRAARQLLARRAPSVVGHAPGHPLRAAGEATLDAATRLVRGLDRSYLPVQGPPGAGKTYTAARCIAELLRDGQTVGITANSHAVIGKLLADTVHAAHDAGVEVRGVQKADGDDGQDLHGVTRVEDNDAVVAALAGGANLVAGTAWLFSREDLAGAVDTLVVDEAGQLSLANVAAVASAARNLVLVGDPQQLAQPSKGTHPDGVGVSALEHVLAGAPTVPDHLGLFLDRTWRMHPAICGFISEQVYDGRLESEPHCAHQTVAPGPVVEGAGLRWAPVDHRGNRTSSPEEAEAVASLLDHLVGRSWTDGKRVEHPIRLDDVLVVAPYNAQVHLLAERLPAGARVGTVDKFQGQEAPVVVVSLTASSADDVPRGMEFLYSRNRLNVAVSRAKALTVVVGSPTLLAAPCRTVAQMRLANVLCRYVELATPVCSTG